MRRILDTPDTDPLAVEDLRRERDRYRDALEYALDSIDGRTDGLSAYELGLVARHIRKLARLPL